MMLHTNSVQVGNVLERQTENAIGRLAVERARERSDRRESLGFGRYTRNSHCRGSSSTNERHRRQELLTGIREDGSGNSRAVTVLDLEGSFLGLARRR